MLWGRTWSGYGQAGELQITNLAKGFLEQTAIEGDSPVGERFGDSLVLIPEYHGTRETLWESGWTITQG